eukprot:maker-scaffold1872_size25940-snap-gene-0.1 protein:Tk08150 transcript:maker-scaffold1872_size25940-snap-gene-0.1-mRNA-1 annotation:"copper homeostasis protein"
MMNIEIEVCIDNLESLHNALSGGANRIELCSSLALGGLTPSFGMMKQAARISSVPVYAMIRPRQGDFIFDDDDVICMLEDIEACASAGLDGVVLGVLAPNGSIDMPKMHQLADKAHSLKLGMTFHRAIDQSSDYQTALEQVITLGSERILTSGLAVNAEQGINVLADMNRHHGWGWRQRNKCENDSKHHPSKSTRPSLMESNSSAQMGSDDIDDDQIPVTDANKISD